MRNVYFRGVNYDPVRLTRLAPQGFRTTVKTADVIDLVSSKNSEVRIAVLVDGKYHLLTGAVETNASMNSLVVVSLDTIKSAQLPASNYADRQKNKRAIQNVTRSVYPLR